MSSKPNCATKCTSSKWARTQTNGTSSSTSRSNPVKHHGHLLVLHYGRYRNTSWRAAVARVGARKGRSVLRGDLASKVSSCTGMDDFNVWYPPSGSALDAQDGVNIHRSSQFAHEGYFYAVIGHLLALSLLYPITVESNRCAHPSTLVYST